MKILLTMKYWWDGKENSTRLRNVVFCWDKLKKLNDFLNKHDLDTTVKLYDFSPKKMIEDSIHIPYPLGEYKKAEKTNKIIKENNDFDYIMMFDSDAFFLDLDLVNIVNIIKNLKPYEVYVFDLAKLNEMDTNKITEKNIDEKNIFNMDFSYAWVGSKTKKPLQGRLSGLGGVYLCDLNIIKEVGGFNEKYVGWGGEDGEIMEKIMQNKKSYKVTHVRDFAPFHLSHFRDLNNKNYSERFK